MVVTIVDSQKREVFNLADPAGGTFDAAGDFDRLIGAQGRWRIWSTISEYGQTTINSDGASELLADLRELLAMASDGPERRGLQRLYVMAEDCSSDVGALLYFHGD